MKNENAAVEDSQRSLLNKQVKMMRRQLARAWSSGERIGLEIFSLRHGSALVRPAGAVLLKAVELS